MTNNYFPDFDVEVVEKKSGMYKVILREEQCAIYLDPEKIQNIAGKVSEEESLVAMVLAYIECVRKNTTNAKDRIEKLDEELVAEAFEKLSRKYSMEELTFYFKSFKWYEIEEIMKSSDPVSALEERG